jgi:RNA polymerase sigma-70 factor (TIGR02943 family)
MPEKEMKFPARPQTHWIEKYSDALFKFARVRVGDRETAKDLVQETFLSALQNIESFRGESSQETWLTAILKNKIIDYYRKRKTANSVPLIDEDGTSELDKYFDEEGEWKSSAGPVSWNASGYQILRSKEFLEILQRCLSKLSDHGRSIFVSKYLDELDSEEICKQLDLTSSNYWVIMHRAKLQIRQCIEKNWINA